MSSFSLSLSPNTVLSPLPHRTKSANPIFHRAHVGNLSAQRPFLRGTLTVTRFGLGQIPLPDPDNAAVLLNSLYDRVEGFLYTIADAAVSSSAPEVIQSTTNTTKQNGDWLSGITNSMEAVLKVLEDGLSTLHVPYAYGFAIILLTVLVKAVTFPLTKKQVESAMAMRSLAPQIKAIQERYAGDQERIQLETARIYKLAGINPLAGCLPTLATIPIWIGLYRALSNVADEGLLSEGFFWIPSLAGPTTIAARQNGSGISWLFPFIDGHPPLGWYDTLAYLVLPVLLVITQYISVQIMQNTQGNDPNMKSSQAITKFLPLMIGYFALSVPSGLSLYWLTNNILSTAQQVWLQKLGGAKNSVRQLSDDIIKKEQAQIQKTTSEAIATKQAPKEAEKLTSDGLRPGERFKQLKEQEARRRQQREEEKRKAEESAAKGVQTSNGKLTREANVVDWEDGNGARVHDANSSDNSSSSSISENHLVNGDASSSEIKDIRSSSSSIAIEEAISTNEDQKVGHQAYKNAEKGEIIAASRNADDGEGTGSDR